MGKGNGRVMDSAVCGVVVEDMGVVVEGMGYGVRVPVLKH